MTFLHSIKQKFKQLDLILIFILVIAAFFRLYLLDLRPVHHDEGVFGWFVDQITANGFYRYDPSNYHGPIHYYILHLAQTLLGRSNWALRLPDALISLMTVYWFTLFSRFFGKKVCLLAALFLTVSPGMVYFGRYAFQEAFLVFYTVLIFWGIVGLWHEGHKKYLWAIGTGITFMILTKETYIIHFGCFIIAWIVLNIYEKISPSIYDTAAVQEWSLKDLIYVILSGLWLIIFFYTGTFLNNQGLLDMFHSFQVWFKTGVKGSGHDKPFIYWGNLIFQYEYFTFLGSIACIRYLFPSKKWIRYIAIYGIGVFLAYSIIPYKTQWCIINLLWPFYFVFADFIVEFYKSEWKKVIVFILIVVGLASSVITWSLDFIDHSNPKIPYVYVQTYPEITKITDPILNLAKKDPSNYNLVGIVLRSDEWPLPWIWGDFPRIGYYGAINTPPTYDADFLVVETSRIYEVEDNLKDKYFTDTATIRNAQDPSKLYLKYDKFKELYPNRQPEFIPAPKKPIEPGQGLLGIYYTNQYWNGNPVFKKVITRLDIVQDEKAQPLTAPFGINLIGEVNLLSDDVTLLLASDDGGYVEIDGKRVIEDLGSHGEQFKTADIKNMKGWRKIKIGYYNIWGYSVFRLKWKDANGNFIVVPTSELRYGSEDLLKR